MLRKYINHLLVKRGSREIKNRKDVESVMRELGKRYVPPEREEDWTEKRIRTPLEEL